MNSARVLHDLLVRRRALRGRGRGARAIYAALAALPLCAASGCAVSPAMPAPTPQVPAESVFVVKRGWHIDIGVAVQELAPPLRSVQAQMPAARYLLFGFGDRRYLTARSKRLDALLAALRPGAALVLLTALSDTPQDAFGAPAVRVLRLDRAQMQAVQTFIWQTLAHAHGLPVRVQSGPYAGSVYLAAQPRYSGLHTCNSWAAQALHATGLPVRVRGVIFAWQLWLQLPRLQRLERQLRASPAGAHAAGPTHAASVRAAPDQVQGGAEPSWQTTVV